MLSSVPAPLQKDEGVVGCCFFGSNLFIKMVVLLKFGKFGDKLHN